MHRLETISPELAAMMRRSSSDQNLKIALAAIDHAKPGTNGNWVAFQTVLEKLIQNGTVPRTEIDGSEATAKNWDEKYFSLGELLDEGKATEEEWNVAFKTARFGFAVVEACAIEQRNDAALESVYEAIVTSDDLEQVVAALIQVN